MTIGEKECQAVTYPDMEGVRADFYMGMNEVHFLFAGFSLKGVDTITVNSSGEMIPYLELIGKGEVVGTTQGVMTQRAEK